ncbi:unnamed protein product [Trichogramma brassicae]|uniref:Uncharacterized protein n=1 Tax=Trichogramma brassicae TaxID=86971 RepID=A0A6H5IAN3_9HYME|nr:unnamed protein product [Trichogramma brassicae]
MPLTKDKSGRGTKITKRKLYGSQKSPTYRPFKVPITTNKTTLSQRQAVQKNKESEDHLNNPNSEPADKQVPKATIENAKITDLDIIRVAVSRFFSNINKKDPPSQDPLENIINNSYMEISSKLNDLPPLKPEARTHKAGDRRGAQDSHDEVRSENHTPKMKLPRQHGPLPDGDRSENHTHKMALGSEF